MSDVTIPFHGDVSAQAVTLLASAEALDLDQSVVRTSTRGFVVPEEVAQTARKEGLEEREAKEPSADPQTAEPGSGGTEGGDRKAPPAKKTAPAKKAAAKKTASATKSTTTKE